MSSEDDLTRLKSRLENVERENAERMALIAKRAAKAMDEVRESTTKLVKATGDVLVRLNERTRRAQAAGGWATESTLAAEVEKDGDFGFEEDEEENERRAGYRSADPLDSLPHAPAPPPAGRHRQRVDHPDEDDYTNTDWLRA